MGLFGLHATRIGNVAVQALEGFEHFLTKRARMGGGMVQGVSGQDVLPSGLFGVKHSPTFLTGDPLVQDRIRPRSF